MSEETLSNLLHEERRFEPPADLAANANVTAEAYDGADRDPVAFWENAAERLSWETKWDRVLDWDDPPFAKWYVGGKLNAAYNCVDRHVEAGKGDHVAFHWVGEPEDDTRTITYAELKDEVCQAANALTELGREDRRPGRHLHADDPRGGRRDAGLCAASGAPHTVVFGGFSSTALRARLQDCDAQGRHHLRRGLPARRCVCVEAGRGRGAAGVPRRPSRTCSSYAGPARTSTGPTAVDLWWHDVVDSASKRAHARGVRRRAPALRHVHVGHDRQAEGHPAHYRRLPGRHGVHALGGLRPQAGDDVYWSAADIGWVTGHSYIVYGPLANGATQVMYEGSRTAPSRVAGGRSSRSTA